MTRASLREHAAVQRERYLQATRGEKRQLLDEVVAVTGIHRKAAIRLLRRQPRAPSVPSRGGLPEDSRSARAAEHTSLLVTMPSRDFRLRQNAPNKATAVLSLEGADAVEVNECECCGPVTTGTICAAIEVAPRANGHSSTM